MELESLVKLTCISLDFLSLEVQRENPHSTRETGRLCTERLGRRSHLGVFLLGGNKANQSVGRDLKLGVLKACKTELVCTAEKNILAYT